MKQYENNVKRSAIFASVTGATLLTVLAVAFWARVTYLLFHGGFDHRSYVMLDQQRSPSGKLVMLAKQHDPAGGNSDQYMILISDHTFSGEDLKHAYWYDGVVFRSGDACLSAEWVDAHTLQVACTRVMEYGGDGIAVQKTAFDGVQITYKNIPMKTGLSP